MKSFNQFLHESGGQGDCMDTAGRAIAFFDKLGDRSPLSEALSAGGGTQRNIRLVHALVSGQGPMNGKRFAHAWAEIGNKVYDYSNGNDLKLDKEVYYMLGRVDTKDKGEYRKYTQEQTIKHISSTHHWGPWELDLSKEILEGEETTLNEERKVFPNTKAKVGKHKVRISKDDMENLK